MNTLWPINILEVFFNRSSTEPNLGSATDIKGSAKFNAETGTTKQHLRPLDAFSGLLMCPKCICGRGSQTQSWWGGAPWASPRPSPTALSFQPRPCLRNDLYCVGRGVKLHTIQSKPFSLEFQPSAVHSLEFRPFGHHEFPPKTNFWVRPWVL